MQDLTIIPMVVEPGVGYVGECGDDVMTATLKSCRLSYNSLIRRERGKPYEFYEYDTDPGTLTQPLWAYWIGVATAEECWNPPDDKRSPHPSCQWIKNAITGNWELTYSSFTDGRVSVNACATSKLISFLSNQLQ